MGVRSIAGFSGYEGRSVLVTGGSGYIGSSLVQALYTLNCDLTLLSRQRHQLDSNAAEAADIKVIVGNISEPDIWEEALTGIDYVFHLAAQTSTTVAGREPVADLNINVLPVIHMLETCKIRNIPAKIMFAGTATEVGLTASIPVDETFPDNPITLYDIHKLAAEKYLQHYAHEHGIRTATLRLSNVYGPGPSSGKTDRGVLNQMARKGLEGDQLSVYGDGTFVRDYVYIDDVVDALLLAGLNIDSLSGNYYVIGTGVGTKFVDAVNLLADKVAAFAGRRPPVAHVEPPPKQSPIEERDFVANAALFKCLTGWDPKVNLEEGLDFTIQSLDTAVNACRSFRGN